MVQTKLYEWKQIITSKSKRVLQAIQMESFQTKSVDNLSMFILFCSYYVKKGAVFNIYRTQHYWLYWTCVVTCEVWVLSILKLSGVNLHMIKSK